MFSWREPGRPSRPCRYLFRSWNFRNMAVSASRMFIPLLSSHRRSSSTVHCPAFCTLFGPLKRQVVVFCENQGRCSIALDFFFFFGFLRCIFQLSEQHFVSQGSFCDSSGANVRLPVRFESCDRRLIVHFWRVLVWSQRRQPRAWGLPLLRKPLRKPLHEPFSRRIARAARRKNS